MRLVVFLAIIAAMITMFIKWRYKLAKVLFVFHFLRKLVMEISENMPVIKQKLSLIFEKPAVDEE